MDLYFVDAAGNEGTISADGSVTYEGPVDVEGYLAELEEETRPDDDHLLVALFYMTRDLDVREVGRADSTRRP